VSITFFKLFSSVSAWLIGLLTQPRFFRSVAVSARWHYRDCDHIGKPFLTFFLIFLLFGQNFIKSSQKSTLFLQFFEFICEKSHFFPIGVFNFFGCIGFTTCHRHNKLDHGFVEPTITWVIKRTSEHTY